MGRKAATYIKPIAPCEAVGEITTGGGVSSRTGPGELVGAPAALRPPSSVHAMRVRIR